LRKTAYTDIVQKTTVPKRRANNMKKGKIKALLVLLVIVLAGIYYYVTIPAINIHSGFLSCLYSY